MLPALFFLTIPFLSAQEQTQPAMSAPLLPMVQPETKDFEWTPALGQSMRFLFIEHGFRLLFQPTTRGQMKGKFFKDYWSSVKSVRGWEDGDHWFINYVSHPMQGAISGYIQVHNDPVGRRQEFGASSEYWKSRLKALAWNTAYSTQFEVGPLSGLPSAMSACGRARRVMSTTS